MRIAVLSANQAFGFHEMIKGSAIRLQTAIVSKLDTVVFSLNKNVREVEVGCRSVGRSVTYMFVWQRTAPRGHVEDTQD